MLYKKLIKSAKPTKLKINAKNHHNNDKDVIFLLYGSVKRLMNE